MLFPLNIIKENYTEEITTIENLLYQNLLLELRKKEEIVKMILKILKTPEDSR